ncbi:MAG: hypothetical protein A2632_00425 [Candidatus Pacebacteria bacterium RIFCSPHIGHO2_01_FULL_46_16]|nr:MAG: hypothetical protein A2632_00425 [Candidatus Pacebacteria bacterium RIFCSPHIGHO2_01_FULL_46_16]OGJ21080.1 MAG: hypothetical protein A3J60_03675 [Candidatus Pacebacteria bacterium RIFCSPHIGHO2_02_FULL_46_9]OGJ38736.1 MAG: hypothetical protein A3A82_03345 [Candidatus Pacebacteria bacterium RIFCSPLOWO2_01_FULL_47_12]
MNSGQHKYNILNAFFNIVENSHVTINPAKISSNRITNVGDALEGYIKDAVVGLLGKQSTSDKDRDILYSKAFSWLGNSSNPPDCMLRGNDAIEIKKIQTLSSDIALNSSHPKNKIYANDIRVAIGAKRAEEWMVKDIIYAIGCTSNKLELQRLWLIYGDCYAASKGVYEKLIDVISRGVTSVPDLDFKKTNELGKINKVDPLGITNMRVRGMWHILNPSRLYSEFVNHTGDKQFYLLMREEKYTSFSPIIRKKIEAIRRKGYCNEKIEIRDPDNPAKLIKARMIKYEI